MLGGAVTDVSAPTRRRSYRIPEGQNVPTDQFQTLLRLNGESIPEPGT